VTDPRLVRYAELLCAYSLDVGEGQRLLVTGPPEAAPLATAVSREGWRRGAEVAVRLVPEWAGDRLLRDGGEAQLASVQPWEFELVERADRWLTIWAAGNGAARSGIDPARDALRRRAQAPLTDRLDAREAAGDLRWSGCGFPTPLGAQRAGMGSAAFERFVYEACLLGEPDPIASWRALGERQALLIERLSGSRELHIRAPGTDLRVGVEGATWANACGTANMPDGEVYTSPRHEQVEGEITFTVPSLEHGRVFEDVWLRFESGVVVESDARVGAEALVGVLDTDAGARRLGEVAIATNARIRRAVGDTLFDEKIGGTCHVALGRAFNDLGGSNSSAIHWDLVCDLRDGGSLEADGRPIVLDGELVDV
jgi:aminopeptidase